MLDKLKYQSLLQHNYIEHFPLNVLYKLDFKNTKNFTLECHFEACSRQRRSKAGKCWNTLRTGLGDTATHFCFVISSNKFDLQCLKSAFKQNLDQNIPNNAIFG